MPTSLYTSSISSTLSTSAIAAVDSVESRSVFMARFAARMTEIPQEVIRQLLSPKALDLADRSSDPLVGLMTELVKASRKNELSASNITAERDQAHGASLAVSVRWLYQMEPNFGEPLTSKFVLKALMPLYLAAGQGRAGNGVIDTYSLIRISCMLAELDRLTLGHELAEWLMDSRRINSDPFESIVKSFRIDLPMMADAFWNEIAVKSESTLNAFENLPEAAKLPGDKHIAWWTLAGQLSSHRAQITVPAELSVGVIAWDKLLDHWQRVSQTLSGEGKCSTTKNSSCGPVGTSSSNAKSIDCSGEENVMRENPTATKDVQKCRIANDHRFVEIRSARDPQLSSNLDQLLQQCRNDQGTLALIVVKKLGSNSASVPVALQNWQSTFIEYMDAHGEATNVRGFISDDGELTLVFHDVERAELAQWIRDSFAKFNNADAESSLVTHAAQPLVAGVSMVNAPSKSFKIDQLIQAAWRCLEGATTQGAGAVKTIEVY